MDRLFTNRVHVAERLFSNRSQMTSKQKSGKRKWSYHILTFSVIYYWTDARLLNKSHKHAMISYLKVISRPILCLVTSRSTAVWEWSSIFPESFSKRETAFSLFSCFSFLFNTYIFFCALSFAKSRKILKTFSLWKHRRKKLCCYDVNHASVLE